MALLPKGARMSLEQGHVLLERKLRQKLNSESKSCLEGERAVPRQERTASKSVSTALNLTEMRRLEL